MGRRETRLQRAKAADNHHKEQSGGQDAEKIPGQVDAAVSPTPTGTFGSAVTAASHRR